MPFEVLVPGFLLTSLRAIGETSNIDLNFADFGFDSDTLLKGIENGPKSPQEKD
jgi:hypothetical protein